MLSLEEIRRALDTHVPEPVPLPDAVGDRAAVALALAGPADDLSLCFILRAEREGDRWSGQMAFPGGRAAAADPTLRDTAAREAREEVGLRLDGAACLGELDRVQLRYRGFETDGIVAPFVFHVGPGLPALRPDDQEVQAADWIPLRDLWDPANCTTLEFDLAGEHVTMPGIRHGDQTIWGLSLRILALFAEALGRPLPCPRYRV